MFVPPVGLAGAVTHGSESAKSRWSRRVRTIPMMLGATIVGLALSPLLLVGAAVVDLAKRRFRLPSVRVVLFLLQYGINDSIEIVLAPFYWLLAGFGSRLAGERSIRRHERVQRWSVAVLARRAERLLGLRLEIDHTSAAVLTPGPVIVLCRHVNIVDASLPTLLYQRLGYRTRGVIMAELLADPGFDLIYGRTGSVFIPRDNGPEALAMMSRLADATDPSTATVIYPEGRLFRPDRLTRSLARLVEQNPARGERLARLRHLLPPRPGGTLALLDTLPAADVVVVTHTGLDRFRSFKELAAAVPLREPIRIAAWRVPRAEVSDDDLARIGWLDEQWLRADRWVAASIADPDTGPDPD
jgi:1-acyl-sn-glycerol-3-phosphate acyltransferase